MAWQKVRRILFGLGIICFALSSFDLAWVFVRSVHATDYMAQFREGIPFSQFGAASSFFAFLLFWFGKRWLKTWSLASLLLCAFWFLIAGASL